MSASHSHNTPYYSTPHNNTHNPHDHYYQDDSEYSSHHQYQQQPQYGQPSHPQPVYHPTSSTSRVELPPKRSYSSSADLESAAGSEPPRKPQEKEPRTWRSFIPSSLACRLYIGVVLLQTIIDVSIEVALYIDLEAAGGRLPIYLGIFSLAHIFQLLLAIDAVYARNTLQFIFLTLFNLLLMGYAIVQVEEVREVAENTAGSIRVLSIIVPIIVAVAEIAYVALGWKIYKEFGWKVYKLLGADRRVKRMYAHFQIFECLVKFDVFFWVGFSVQWIFLVLDDSDWEYYLTIAALPLSILLLIQGHLAARHENKLMMASFMTGCVAACIYFIYKQYRIVTQRNTEEIRLVFSSLTIFSVLAMIFLLATFVSGVIVFRNFGEGLKFHMGKHKQVSRDATSGSVPPEDGKNHFQMSSNPKRMSIN